MGYFLHNKQIIEIIIIRNVYYYGRISIIVIKHKNINIIKTKKIKIRNLLVIYNIQKDMKNMQFIISLLKQYQKYNA